MTLLLRIVVVVVTLLVPTTATPPPGYVKQPDNHKNSPSYRYQYEVEDKLGDGQGKTETREGEHASGRYYVNSKRSSTNVKYIADEWGYHPLVEYGTSDDHSSASASFAIGEHAVKDLQNENVIQSTPSSIEKEDEKLVQIIQPYHTISKDSKQSHILSNNKTFTSQDISISFIGSEISPQTNLNSVKANSLNYVINNDTVSSPTNEIYLATNQSPKLVPSLTNDLTSTVSEEDKLIVHTAGNFGQRLHLQNNDFSVYFAATTTASPISTQSEISPTSSTTRDGRYFSGKTREKNDNQYLPDTIPGLSAYSSTPFPPLDNSVTANSIEFESGKAQTNENNGIIDSVESGAYSTADGSSITTSNPLLINYASHGILSGSSEAGSIETSEEKDYGFLKPIVVPDFPKEKPFQYSTTFICEDDLSTNTPNPLTFIKNNFGETTSSHILNPIQAGVSLLNAGKAHLISSNAILKEKPPAPVSENVNENPQIDQSAAHLSNTVTAQNNYVGINPAFGVQTENSKSNSQSQTELQKPKVQSQPQAPLQVHFQQQSQAQQQSQSQSQFQQQTQPQSLTNQLVEIQKSIEIYHSSPSQEIHYSEQPVISQSTYVDQQQQTQTFEGQQEHQPYFTNNQEINFKQENSQSNDETLTKVHDANDNYLKKLVRNKPVYVVQPATYIIEDNSVLKSALLQENIQHQEIGTNQNELKNKLEEQQIQIKVQTDAGQQPYRNFDSAVSHESEINQQQQNNGVQQEANFETFIEKTVHVPHPYLVEKIIEKKVPYPVEKIIEKKVPIPHPYPVPVQVSVPQPVPIPVEKFIERKVPIPVHIPVLQPYPIEKPIHIPVPIEKIVEKPVHIPVPVEKVIEKKIPVPQPYPIEIEKIIERKIPYAIEIPKYVDKSITLHAPYGVQYGVSYQQIMKPQNQGLYSIPSNNLSPLYALSVSFNNLYNSKKNFNNKNLNDVGVNNLNQSFQGYVYNKPSVPFIEGKNNIENNLFANSKTIAKKLSYNSYVPSNYPVQKITLNTPLYRRHTATHRQAKPERDDYFGPVPPVNPIQRQYGFQSKAFTSYSSTMDRMQNSRKSRNHDPVRYQKGNFRQSKIEYGFKPPMVPSVQYDEETASKVES